MKALLGGKGANLHEMTRIRWCAGSRSPLRFAVIFTIVARIRRTGGAVAAAMAKVENPPARFGDRTPLLVSVRWASRFHPECVFQSHERRSGEIVAKRRTSGLPGTYRRFLQMWRRGDGVQSGGRSHEPFEAVIGLKDSVMEARLPRCAIDRRRSQRACAAVQGFD
jgi:hypothetical protein